MFGLFQQTPSDFKRIDNPGGGNCGYYALMMGIIHLAKSPETKEEMKETIEKWKELDTGAVKDIDTALSSQIDILDWKDNRDLMYRLQKSLRKLLAEKYISSIPLSVEDIGPKKVAAFDQFKSLVENVVNTAGTSKEDNVWNPLCHESCTALRRIACAIKDHLEQLKFPHSPRYQEIVHQEFIAASFIHFRTQVITAYNDYYVGLNSWATEQCLIKLAFDCLGVPIQFLTNGNPNDASILPLNGIGVRLNNERNYHWTLYLPEKDSSKAQAAVDVQNQEGNKRTIFDKRKGVEKQRQKWTSDHCSYLLEKEKDLGLDALFQSLCSENIEKLDCGQCDASEKKYSNLFALHAAHHASDNDNAQHGNHKERHPYDREYLNLELLRCQYNFQPNSENPNFEHQIEELRKKTILEIREEQAFKQRIANLKPKDVNDKNMSFNNNHPRYALNGCLGGLMLGGIIVGSSPELVAVTAAALSFSPIGAIFTLLLASMFIAIMLTLLTLYLMDKCTGQDHTMMNMV
jgi:hypothetical protein